MEMQIKMNLEAGAGVQFGKFRKGKLVGDKEWGKNRVK